MFHLPRVELICHSTRAHLTSISSLTVPLTVSGREDQVSQLTCLQHFTFHLMFIILCVALVHADEMLKLQFVSSSEATAK